MPDGCTDDSGHSPFTFFTRGNERTTMTAKIFCSMTTHRASNRMPECLGIYAGLIRMIKETAIRKGVKKIDVPCLILYRLCRSPNTRKCATDCSKQQFFQHPQTVYYEPLSVLTSESCPTPSTGLTPRAHSMCLSRMACTRCWRGFMPPVA